MKITGTQQEVLKYLTTEFASPYENRPKVPRVGDRWEMTESLTFEKQLNSLSSPNASIFFYECTGVRQNMNFIQEPHAPLITVAINFVTVSITPE
jgi:hypothetical protein